MRWDLSGIEDIKNPISCSIVSLDEVLTPRLLPAICIALLVSV